MKKIFFLLIILISQGEIQAQTHSDFWILTPGLVNSSQEWVEKTPRNPVLPNSYRKAREVYMEAVWNAQTPVMPQNLRQQGLNFVRLNKDYAIEFIPGERVSGQTSGAGRAKAGTWLIYDSILQVYTYPYCLNRFKSLVPLSVVKKYEHDTTQIKVVKDTVTVRDTVQVFVDRSDKTDTQPTSPRRSGGGIRASYDRTSPATQPTQKFVSNNSQGKRDTKQVVKQDVEKDTVIRWGLVALTVVAAGLVAYAVYLWKKGQGEDVVYEPHHTTSQEPDPPVVDDYEDHKTVR